jgi:3-dehydroquinate synthase
MKTMITTITKEHLLQEIPEGSYIVMDGYFRAHFEEKLSKHYVYWLHEAETSKNLTIFEDICSYFLSHGVDRQSTIWAIGGGATSDLAGFVAATLLRGISWRVVPTTLLSQLDASLGGKVAVNHDSGKNLIGAFHEPEAIYISNEWITTLSQDEINSGIGELVKYALLSQDIFSLVLKNKVVTTEVILKCLEFKKMIVEKDPFEKNVRKCLNLGHTLGHAFEILGKMNHGQAVLLGMEVLLKSFKFDSDYQKLMQLKKHFNLEELKIPKVDTDQFWKMVFQDKKKTNQQLNLIFPDSEHIFSIKTISLDECRKIVSESYETLA